MTDSANPATEASTAAAIEGTLTSLFGGTPTPAAEPEPEAQPEQAQESPAAAPEGDADENGLTPDDIPADEAEIPQPAEGELEIVHNGRRLKVTRDEAVKLAQQGYDYTAKTEQLAAERRQVAEMLEQARNVQQMHVALADEMATLKSLDKQLEPWQNVDWVRLATDEPLEYARYRAQYDQMWQSRQAAFQQFQSKAQAVQAQQAQVTQQMLRQELGKLQEKIPAWKDSERFQRDARDVRSYLMEQGADAAEVDNLTSAVAVSVAYKAMQYDRLLKSKGERNKQVRTAPPVMKPGSPVTRGEQAKADFRDMRGQLKQASKSGNTRAQEQLVTKMLERTFTKK